MNKTQYLVALGLSGVPASEAARRASVSRQWASFVYQRAGIASRSLVQVHVCKACGKLIRSTARYCNSACQRIVRRDVRPDGKRECRHCHEYREESQFYTPIETRCIACVLQIGRERRAANKS